MNFHARSSSVAAALSLLAAVSAQAGSVSVYLSAPFTQTAGGNGTSNTGGFTGTSTETFTNTLGGNTNVGINSTGTFKTYNSPNNAINGTYTTPASNTGFQVIANGQYGGGGQGNYLGIPNGQTTTLTLNAPVGYLGLEWCAVDLGNSLNLFDQNNVLIGTFNAATFQQILADPAKPQITAVNGSKYNTVDYLGQPTGTTTTTGRLNTGEYYAYLNFVGDATTKISRIEFSESTAAIFESDNHAVLTNAPTVNSSSPLVFVTAVPEPSTYAMIFAAGALMIFTLGRRRKGRLAQ